MFFTDLVINEMILLAFNFIIEDFYEEYKLRSESHIN